MPNIIDYLKWRGDLTFKQSQINEIDNIILSRFSYLPFKKIKLKDLDNIENIAKQMEDLSRSDFIWNDDAEFIQELGKSERYKNLIISDYSEIVDLSAEKQFAAITIWLPNKYKYISFRGTDASLVGWKEDLNMSFMQDVPSQKEAVIYLNKIANKYRDKLIIGGHSKGGNLAVYSAVFCNNKAKSKIDSIINADGPGIDKSIIGTDNYKKILNKIHTYIPQSSVVGRLLEHEEEYQIVKSTQKGIMQHDIYSWQINVTELVRIQNLTNNSQVFNKVVRKWLTTTTPKQRENFINIVYEIIATTDIKNTSDFKINTGKKITQILGAYKNISNEDKEEIEKMLKILFESTIKTLKENKKYRREEIYKEKIHT